MIEEEQEDISIDADPRTRAKRGHYLRPDDPVKYGRLIPTLSLADILVLIGMIAACAVVASVLWLRPPKFRRFDAPANPNAPGIPAALNKKVTYDQTKFHEVTDEEVDRLNGIAQTQPTTPESTEIK